MAGQPQQHGTTPFSYGGQAVIEGVMIRGARYVAVAARRPDGYIVTTSYPVPTWVAGTWRKIPFVRGTLILFETLVTGIRALTFSAQVAAGEEEEDQPISPWAIALTLATSIGLAIALFFIAPLVVTAGVVDRFTDSPILSNTAEGVIRMAIFFAYLGVIGLMPTIRRVFAYHAAEHMAVHAHEAGLTLEPQNVRRFPAAHPRCGTAFLLTVMIVSIIIFALLGTPDLPLRIASRIVLIPVIAGISYEVIRFNARHSTSAFVAALSAPSLALQALTTRQPDDAQIEVAITAMRTAMDADSAHAAAA
jgi:uncharacterized protein YqhQ